MALNAAMATAARSLEVFQTGIEVAGQNVANANTPGYVREELNIDSGRDYRVGRIVKGTGSNLTGIRLAVDTYLEQRVHAANSDLANSQTRSNAYLALEGVVKELGSSDVSTRVNELLGALNNFASEPTLGGLRELVLTQGRELADAIGGLSDQVTRVRNAYDTRLEATVTEANELIDNIHELNVSIVKLEGGGTYHSDAGSLRSERLAALDRLSEIVTINVDEFPDGRIDVRAGDDYLVQYGGTKHYETIPLSARYDVADRPEHERGYKFVQIAENGSQNLPEGGELSGLISARDDVLGGFLADLDDYAAAFIQEFNRVHAGGSGTAAFTEVTADFGATDTTAVLNDPAAGLDFVPRHGSFDIVVQDATTGVGVTTTIAVDLDGIGGNDTTLDDLTAAVDVVAGINASLDADGRLSIVSDAGREFRFDGDSSGVLATLGINTFFSGKDAASIAVNDVLVRDPQKLASGRGGGPGDARNAVALIELMDRPVDSAGGQTLDAAYETLVFGVAQNSRAERNDAEGFAGFHDSLQSQREQYSGVSIDEETVKIMQYQHSYQAAARVLSTVDELMQILINL